MNDKVKKLLIGIIIFIILCLFLLTTYIILAKKDNKEDKNEPSNKILNAYYLINTDVINDNILDYRYSAIINNEISHSDFRKNYLIKNIVDSLEPIGSIGCDNESLNREYDKNGVEYPLYCDGLSCIENYAKEFGLTVDEISKMDKEVWENILKEETYCNYMYDINDFKESYQDVYNDVFSSSFSLDFSNDLDGATSVYIYDKNIDKIVTDSYLGTASFDERVILETKEEKNLYKVIFVEGHFILGGKWMRLAIDYNEEISDRKEASEVVKKNKDKLPKYEVTFEKVKIGYKYKSIRKVS